MLKYDDEKTELMVSNFSQLKGPFLLSSKLWVAIILWTFVDMIWGYVLVRLRSIKTKMGSTMNLKASNFFTF